MYARYIAVNLVNLFTAVVESFLGLRFLLRLFGANQTGFVQWVYNMSDGLLAPFRGIFPTTVLEDRYVLEFSTLFAMLMYAILALILVWLINLVSPAPVVAATTKRRVR
jgi:YggT family protein